MRRSGVPTIEAAAKARTIGVRTNMPELIDHEEEPDLPTFARSTLYRSVSGRVRSVKEKAFQISHHSILLDTTDTSSHRASGRRAFEASPESFAVWRKMRVSSDRFGEDVCRSQ